MKAIMLLFDTLNLRMLQPYGCDWTKTPNFQRLAEHTVTFDQCWAGSLPCMPARRELHTGRYNFLHRSWGPVEPFDDSMPEILRSHHVYTHLISDHQHYWEDGGATYHHRYDTWEIIRGQEGDRWIGQVRDPAIPDHLGRAWRQDEINRSAVKCEQDMPISRVMNAGIEFIRRNQKEDNWFLHLECFDPHEPFFAWDSYRAMYPDDYQGPRFDWPDYAHVHETPEQIAHCRRQYAALLTEADAQLGRFLDVMDELDLWKDTLLIVNTDHGFLLGEHDLWGKSAHPWYSETAHIPLFIWDPRCQKQGERRNALVQNIDIPLTLLGFFGVPATKDMQGIDLKNTIESDQPAHDYVLFGMHGGQVNITDGHYVYMRSPVEGNKPLYQYTVMPTHMRSLFSVEEMKTATLHPGFSFTKGMPVLKIEALEDKTGDTALKNPLPTVLFDIDRDPQQLCPLNDEKTEERMKNAMIRKMQENDAPAEQFIRLGLE